MAQFITPNSIARVNAGDLDLKPVMQVGDVKAVGAGQRYSMTVSDGSATARALLTTQLNDVVKSGRLKSGSIVQLLEYCSSVVQNNRIIMVLNMEVIKTDYNLIGNLKHLSAPSSQSTALPTNNISSLSSRSTPSTNYNNNPQNFNHIIQPSYRPPPKYKNQGAITKNEAPPRVIPIDALNPYQGRWAIKARVTSKGELRRYNNARGDGKVFSFDLLDSEGGEIRATCFNAALERFYDIIEVGKVYLISKGSLKPSRKDYNHLNNQWEIFLDATSTVELSHDDNSSIPTVQFNFKHVSEIENIESNSIIDVIGIVTSANPSTSISRKNGTETRRKILTIKDESERSVELTLWGDFCNQEGQEIQEMFDSGIFTIVAVKSGKVNDFIGKSVGTISTSQLFINPDFPEAIKLREWFDGGGKNITSQSISKDAMPGISNKDTRKYVSQIKDEGLGRGEKPDWVIVKATVTFIKTDNFCYTACPLMIGDRQCGKKVNRVGNGNWCCDRCDREFEECDYRYLLNVQVQDHSGLAWVKAFQETGEEILGCTAKELYKIKNEEEDDMRFSEIVRRSLFEQYLFKFKIKEEMYNDEQRVNLTVVKVEKVDPSAESRHLLDLIMKM